MPARARIPVLDGFPRYDDGDVEVVLSPSLRLKLHSSTLNHSNVFARLLAEPGAGLSKAAKSTGATLRYCIWYKPLSDGTYQWERVEVDSNGKIKASFGSEILNGRSQPYQISCLEDCLRALYDQPGALKDDDLDATAAKINSVFDGAERLQVTHRLVVKAETILLAYGQTLYKVIAANPKPWLQMGCRLLSRTIFLEALIHFVGRFPDLAEAFTESPVARMVQGMDRLVQTKRDELVKQCQAFERKVSMAYPDYIIPTKETNQGGALVPHQRDYQSKAFTWIAQAFYHKWLATEFTVSGHSSPDSGYKLYLKLSHGGSAYLDRSSFDAFFGTFAMNTKMKGNIIEEVNKLKNLTATMTSGILKSNCKYDNPQWLTCTTLDDDEYPFFRDCVVADLTRENRKIVRDAESANRAEEERRRNAAIVARAAKRRSDAERMPPPASKRGRKDGALRPLGGEHFPSPMHQPIVANDDVVAVPQRPTELTEAERRRLMLPPLPPRQPVEDVELGSLTLPPLDPEGLRAAEALMILRDESD